MCSKFGRYSFIILITSSFVASLLSNSALRSKNNFFTFQVGDVIIKGVVSEESEESFDEIDLEKFVIKEVNPIQDKDGTIHSWELICV